MANETTKTQIDELITQVFVGEAQEALRQSEFAFSKIKKIALDENNARDTTVKIAVAPEPTVGTWTEGTASTYNTLADSKIDVTLDKKYEAAFTIGNLVQKFTHMNDLDLMAKTIKNGVGSLLEQIEEDFFTAINAGYTTITAIGASELAVSAETIWRAARLLTDQKVALQNRYLPLAPKDIEALVADGRLSNVAASGSSAALREGKVDFIGGFEIMSNPSIAFSDPTYTTSAFQADSVVMATSKLEDIPPDWGGTEIYIDPIPGLRMRLRNWYEPTSRTFPTVIDCIYGFKVLRANGGVVINS